MDTNNRFDVIIEVQKDTGLKYEIDETSPTGPTLRLDRILTSSMSYPGNYGYIPNTMSMDGDPLDVLLVTPYQLHPGCVVLCKALGVLIMTDEKGLDEKIIAVPDETVDSSFVNVNTLEDLSQVILDSIEHFFQYYKVKEKNKWTNVETFQNKKEADKLIRKYMVENSL